MSIPPHSPLRSWDSKTPWRQRRRTSRARRRWSGGNRHSGSPSTTPTPQKRSTKMRTRPYHRPRKRRRSSRTLPTSTISYTSTTSRADGVRPPSPTPSTRSSLSPTRRPTYTSPPLPPHSSASPPPPTHPPNSNPSSPHRQPSPSSPPSDANPSKCKPHTAKSSPPPPKARTTSTSPKKLSSSRPLTVEGDLPTTDFLLSHAETVLLTNVPPHLTPHQISSHFQPHCPELRDTHGSIQFALDLAHQPTGRVYVGFDTSHSHAAFLSSLPDAHHTHLPHTAHPTPVYPVKERTLPRGGERLGPRTYRSAAALHYEIHSSWREHVSDEQMQTLQEAGVDTTVLADAFLAVRNGNPTFGAED